MKHQRIGTHIVVVLAATLVACLTRAAYAIDVTAGDWKLSFDGNVNAHYVYSMCQDVRNAVAVTGGLACISNDNGSGVSNGLLPAALSVSGATTQKGFDIAFTFGLYPGISTNDGGSPNLHDNPAPTNVALGTAGLDIRQVFLTFGNSSMGTVLAGRNIGLFAADAILNDMTLLGVGAAGTSYAAPTNTSLGSIGLGYIYTDWLPQIDYTTPELLGGAKFTLGVFSPLNTLQQPLPSSKKQPGIHAKAVYKAGALYLSASGLYQEQKCTVVTLAAPCNGNYTSWAADLGGMFDFAGFQIMGWYYYGRGVGTTGLFNLSNDANGNLRNSNGFLAQITYKLPVLTDLKLGVQYGTSKLDQSNVEFGTNPTLLSKNDKITFGGYYNLTENLLLLSEFSYQRALNQAGNENQAKNFNIGAFLKF
jgi:predicted porin